MPIAHIIEIDDIAAAVIVATEGGFRFFAAEAAFRSLDRGVFCSIARANQVLRETLAKPQISLNSTKGLS